MSLLSDLLNVKPRDFKDSLAHEFMVRVVSVLPGGTSSLEAEVARSFDTFAELENDEVLTYTASETGTVTAGDRIFLKSGQSYEVAPTGASDHHAITTGGVKLYEAGCIYSTRARLVAAKARGEGWEDGWLIFDGTRFYKGSSAATTISDLAGVVPVAPVYADHWGVAADDTTDDGAKLQAAITWCEDNFEDLNIKGLLYSSIGLRVKKPLHIRMDNHFGFGSSATRPNTRLSKIRFGGSVTTALHVEANTDGDYVYGGGVHGCWFDGNNVATNGVYTRDTVGYKVDLWCDKFTGIGFELDSNESTASNQNRDTEIRYYKQTLGGSATYGATGIKFTNCTRVLADTIVTETDTGCGVDFRKIDASSFRHLQCGFRDNASSPGYGVCFRGAKTARGDTKPARRNFIFYYGGYGSIYTENSDVSGARNPHNVIQWINGEGPQVLFESDSNGEGVLFYNAITWKTGELFTNNRYPMKDELRLPSTIFAQDAGITGTSLVGGSESPSIEFGTASGSANNKAVAFMPAPHWYVGTITGVKIRYTSAADAGNFYVGARVDCFSVADGLDVKGTAVFSTIAASSSGNGIKEATITITEDYLLGDSLTVTIMNDSTHGNNTATEAFKLLEAVVLYESDGPPDGGALDRVWEPSPYTAPLVP